MLYEAVFKALQKERVRYLLVGGIAVNLYGVLRATADLDIFLWLDDSNNIAKFVKIMNKLGYKPRVPVKPEDLQDPKKRDEWRKKKGAIVFTFVHPNSFEQVDIFLKQPIPFEPAYKRRNVINIGSFKITVASLDDLKKMKQKAGREKDRSDILNLQKIRAIRKA